MEGEEKGNEIHFLAGDISELLYRTVLCELHHNVATEWCPLSRTFARPHVSTRRALERIEIIS